MKKIILTALCIYCVSACAQNNTASNLIEGGKTIVELVKVFKTPRNNIAAGAAVAEKTDSCAAKNISDISFKNSTGKNIYITLTKRNGSVYEPTALTVKVLNKAQENLYELRTGIYKLKIETDGEGDKRILYREGEIKLAACNNAVREIKPE